MSSVTCTVSSIVSSSAGFGFESAGLFGMLDGTTAASSFFAFESLGLVVADSVGFAVVDSVDVVVIDSFGLTVVDSLGLAVTDSFGFAVVDSMDLVVTDSFGFAVVDSLGLEATDSLFIPSRLGGSKPSLLESLLPATDILPLFPFRLSIDLAFVASVPATLVFSLAGSTGLFDSGLVTDTGGF